MEYNLNYLVDIKNDYDNQELDIIINNLDKKISEYKPNFLFHLVPILYSTTFILGISTFVYKIFL